MPVGTLRYQWVTTRNRVAAYPLVGSACDSRGVHWRVDFWDVTNRQDWAACESVQRGLASPHFRPGPFAPNEDAVAQLVQTIRRAYEADGFEV